MRYFYKLFLTFDEKNSNTYIILILFCELFVC